MKIDHIPIPLTALLGKATLPMKEYLGLQEGDILVLDQAYDQNIQIRLGKNGYYLGRIGIQGNQKAVIIDERIYSR